MIRVVLPAHLRTIAKVSGEVQLAVEGQVTQRSVLDALEAQYPTLQGTIRDHVTQKRRPFVRFFACEQDLSHESPDAPLPAAVASGAEPFLVVGAIAGGRDSLRPTRLQLLATSSVGLSGPGGAQSSEAVPAGELNLPKNTPPTCRFRSPSFDVLAESKLERIGTREPVVL
jgi:molybdopterin converting factor small subunit